MKYNHFRDLEVWKEGKVIAIILYKLLDGRKDIDYGLQDQIKRASISISSNIAEGFERQTNPEFIRFLYIAKGSSGELMSQILILHELGKITESECNDIIGKLESISKQLGGFIKYLVSKIKK